MLHAAKQRACFLGPEDALSMARSEKVNAVGGGEQSGCRQPVGVAASGAYTGSRENGQVHKAFKTTGSLVESDKEEHHLTCLLIFFWMEFTHVESI